MEGGLCYFDANPDKAAELGRNGGRRRKHTYEQAPEQISPPESAADVKRMLAETMAEVKAGRMDPKVANTVAYLGTILLRAYEADAASAAPRRPNVPLIYRSLMILDGLKHEPDDVIDLIPASGLHCQPTMCHALFQLLQRQQILWRPHSRTSRSNWRFWTTRVFLVAADVLRALVISIELERQCNRVGKQQMVDAKR
jgi:hypothetical protein